MKRAPVALEAIDVHKRYGPVVALGGVTLRVDAGECLALVGESGSGKTTLLRMFNAMVTPDAGAVTIDGRDVPDVHPVQLRRRTGYVPQEGGLIPHWRVLRNVELVPRLLGETDARASARDALDRVGLPPDRFGDRWPRDLSGGERQRVAVARALAGDPGVVLLDEPFGALDAITRAEIQEQFLALRGTLSATTLLVTHDLREAFRLADRIAVLREGRIEQLADVESLRSHPATPYVGALLARSGTAPAGASENGGTT